MTEQPSIAGALERGDLPTERSPELERAELGALVAECAARFADPTRIRDVEARLGNVLEDVLRSANDIHANRFSAQRYRDMYHCFFFTPRERPELAGKRVLDLGCGAVNPVGLSFLLLLLGARSTTAIDGEPVQDIVRALRAIPEIASLMLVDPQRLFEGHGDLSREELVERLVGFDLAAIGRGELEAIPTDRLQYRVADAEALPAEDDAYDLVLSNSFLEHISSPRGVATELARVTAPGGIGLHVVDGTDHRVYRDARIDRFEFLCEATDAPIVHGSNRLRRPQLAAVFEDCGFDCSESYVLYEHTVDEERARQFMEPWRSMDIGELRAAGWMYVMRRR